MTVSAILSSNGQYKMCTLHIHTSLRERVPDFDIPFSNEKAVNNTERSSVEEIEIPPTYLTWEKQIE